MLSPRGRQGQTQQRQQRHLQFELWIWASTFKMDGAAHFQAAPRQDNPQEEFNHLPPRYSARHSLSSLTTQWFSQFVRADPASNNKDGATILQAVQFAPDVALIGRSQNNNQTSSVCKDTTGMYYMTAETANCSHGGHAARLNCSMPLATLAHSTLPTMSRPTRLIHWHWFQAWWA